MLRRQPRLHQQRQQRQQPSKLSSRLKHRSSPPGALRVHPTTRVYCAGSRKQPAVRWNKAARIPDHSWSASTKTLRAGNPALSAFWCPAIFLKRIFLMSVAMAHTRHCSPFGNPVARSHSLAGCFPAPALISAFQERSLRHWRGALPVQRRNAREKLETSPYPN